MQRSTQYLKKLGTTLAVSGCVMFAAVYFMLSSVNAPCHNASISLASHSAVSTHQLQKGNADVDALCNRNSQQINWVTWIFKQPDSAQFHFVDLLELLERNP